MQEKGKRNRKITSINLRNGVIEFPPPNIR